MMYQNILYTHENGVARVTLNRPDKLNSFNAAMHEEVHEALDRIAGDRATRVLVLTGAGRGFCAGQDLGDRAVSANSEPADLGASIERFYAPMVLKIRALPLPVVCAVNGVAAGAGVSLALACDLVIAKQSASFIQSFAKLGLIPDTGGTYFLPRLLGPARALGLAMLGEKLPAQQAADWGLIWRCIEDEVFEHELEALIAHLAAAATKGLARTKQAIYNSLNNTLEAQLMQEANTMRELGYSRDYREGVQAFLEKRSPRFQGE